MNESKLSLFLELLGILLSSEPHVCFTQRDILIKINRREVLSCDFFTNFIRLICPSSFRARARARGRESSAFFFLLLSSSSSSSSSSDDRADQTPIPSLSLPPNSSSFLPLLPHHPLSPLPSFKFTPLFLSRRRRLTFHH